MKEQNNVLEEVPYHELKAAYQHLEKKNKDLIDGLYYAAFVQQGLLPQARHFRRMKRPFYVTYIPLHIIGGDFFWIGKKNNWLFYAVGDCTGHGVSGAMLSSLAIGFLNYVVYSKDLTTTGEVLNEMDKKWIETFKKDDDEDVNNDWLELSLIAYDTSTGEIQYSGSNSSIILIDHFRELHVLKGNPFPIGGWQIEAQRSFTTQSIHLTGRNSVYLYSDGFRDQFGGLSNKRIGMKRFTELLHKTCGASCETQKEIMEDELLIWRGQTEQTDDICVLRTDFEFNV